MEVIPNDSSRVTAQLEHSLLNVSYMGETFGIPTTRMNLILSELGWIAKEGKDWRITESGKSLGGVQCQHDRSQKLYVRWPAAILANRTLLNSVRQSRGELPIQHPSQVDHDPLHSQQFRDRFLRTYWTMDGHCVRSKAEAIIDNWLYHYKICHAYEKRLPVDEDVYCDFFINGQRGVYIEYWGNESNPKYLSRKQKKIETYQRHALDLIQLTEKEVSAIDDCLPQRLRPFGIDTE